MLKTITFPQPLLREFSAPIFPQLSFPHSTAPVEKFWSVKSLKGCGNVTFLSPNKKVTKEVGWGEGVDAKSIDTAAIYQPFYPDSEPLSPPDPSPDLIESFSVFVFSYIQISYHSCFRKTKLRDLRFFEIYTSSKNRNIF